MTRPNVPLPHPSWKGRALGALFLLFALVTACVFVFKAAHTAGLAGQPSTLTIEECSVEDDPEKAVCIGTFDPDDGSPAVYYAEVTVHSLLRQGEKIEVQRTGFGFVLAGARETWNMAFGFFIAWIVAAPGVPFAVTGIPPSKQQTEA